MVYKFVKCHSDETGLKMCFREHCLNNEVPYVHTYIHHGPRVFIRHLFDVFQTLIVMTRLEIQHTWTRTAAQMMTATQMMKSHHHTFPPSITNNDGHQMNY